MRETKQSSTKISNMKLFAKEESSYRTGMPPKKTEIANIDGKSPPNTFSPLITWNRVRKEVFWKKASSLEKKSYRIPGSWRQSARKQNHSLRHHIGTSSASWRTGRCSGFDGSSTEMQHERFALWVKFSGISHHVLRFQNWEPKTLIREPPWQKLRSTYLVVMVISTTTTRNTILSHESMEKPYNQASNNSDNTKT